MTTDSLSKKLNQTLALNLDKETRMEKLTSMDKYLEAALANEEGPEGKIILRIMITLTEKKVIKELFKGSTAELALQRRIISQCA